MVMRRTPEDLEEHKRELVSTLDHLLEQGEAGAGSIRNLLIGMHHADTADVLDVMDPEDAARVLSLLDMETASDILAEMEEAARIPLLELVDPRELATLVEEMPTDDAADLVGDLDEGAAEEVLSHVAPQEREEIEELLVHEEDTAGGRMELDFVAVNQRATVDEAVEAIRLAAEEVEALYYVYVVDDEERLVGLLRLRDLILARGSLLVADLMNVDVISVPLDMDQEDVAHLVQQYDLAAIPVVGGDGKLVGRITHDDIADVLEEEIEEDLRRMAGVGDEDLTERSSIRVAGSRLPWIVTSLFSALLAAFIISYNRSLLEEYLTLAFFFPLITAIGGNIGLQSSMIVVRGLATGQSDLIHAASRIFKEVRVGLAMGVICGLVVGLFSWFWIGHAVFGLIVGLSMLTAIIVAATMGTVVPMVFDQLRIDPAIATGPFVTMSNDIIGLLIYFALASLLLQAFGLAG